ncbi:magnesium-translocating P-type ATPase [Ralstonia soli]|uniref:Magnesium-transporting ATPase, P-type 1 n=1 Tax=Ralstonia soli TaxID=2953896 RepID=A0ABT1AKC8_9RALS|nr:magnesium-translocating P-type ATPase [Ralstonia soli]MCO5398875.1 magnesium-translocating P-type ATPase [Ralstonia soli]
MRGKPRWETLPTVLPSRTSADDVSMWASLPAHEVLARLQTQPHGLTQEAASQRLRECGLNRVANGHHEGVLLELVRRSANPLNLLLISLAGVSAALGDVRAAVLIAVMVVLSVVLGFLQEHRSNRAAEALRRMVHTTATVRRLGADSGEGIREIPIEQLVPGDIVQLSAGDMVPADVRLLDAKDVFVNQSALTGEAMPQERHAQPSNQHTSADFDLPNLCFMGSAVVSGYATGVVLTTGQRTAFGHVANLIAAQRVQTSFDRGITRFTWLMLTLILVMAPTVFLINGLTKGNWFEALLFAVAVAVGLTPEMLPMIVTVNLAKGAIAMSRKKVIVKRLNAIQNFGAMDVLCTDKTGTLTQDRIILKHHLDLRGEESDQVLEYAFLNSFYQSGLKNLLDVAVLKHVELEQRLDVHARFRKVDELPFDFERRRMSVVLARDDGTHVLICKGAVEEVLAVSTRYVSGDEAGPLETSHLEQTRQLAENLNADGFRAVAVAYKELPPQQNEYAVADESGLTLLGYIAFLDPPRETAAAALAALKEAGVAVKILTGDNAIVARKICREVGLAVEPVVLGTELAAMSPEQVADIAERASVFAKVSPAQKAAIVEALHRRGHVVGFMGDGINDGPALKAADVGISVDSAVDIAKESADIILLEKSLAVLGEGVTEGRKVFGNIVKYIKMGASSNFGNMFSVLGASLFLPFLPMAPVQVLLNNLLYDFSQTAIPTDNVDEDYLVKPRRWEIGNILKFMLYMGPVSSVFDFATYALLLGVFHAWSSPPLFQSGWFVESLLTQTLIIHIIRTGKVPFVQSRASTPLVLTSVAIACVGVAMPLTPVGALFGFVPLPVSYWPCLAAIVLAYGLAAYAMKAWYVRRYGLD